VSRKRSPGKGSHIVIYDPDDLTVAEIFKRARETLEALVRK
jgi:hypothetical protein